MLLTCNLFNPSSYKVKVCSLSVIYKQLANSLILQLMSRAVYLRYKVVWLGLSLQLYYLSQYLKNEGFQFNFLLRHAVFGRDPVRLFNI